MGTDGFVYFMQCEDTSRIKIGFSTNPKRRCVSLNGGSTSVVLLACFPGTTDEESALHSRFREALVAHLNSREWFYPVPPLVELVRSHGGNVATAPIVPGVVAGYAAGEALLGLAIESEGRAQGLRTEARGYCFRLQESLRDFENLVASISAWMWPYRSRRRGYRHKGIYGFDGFSGAFLGDIKSLQSAIDRALDERESESALWTGWRWHEQRNLPPQKVETAA